MITKRLAPPIGEQKLCHVHLPEGKTPPGGGVLGGLFYDGDSGIGGAGVLLDGGEK